MLIENYNMYVFINASGVSDTVYSGIETGRDQGCREMSSGTDRRGETTGEDRCFSASTRTAGNRVGATHAVQDKGIC